MTSAGISLIQRVAQSVYRAALEKKNSSPLSFGKPDEPAASDASADQPSVFTPDLVELVGQLRAEDFALNIDECVGKKKSLLSQLIPSRGSSSNSFFHIDVFDVPDLFSLSIFGAGQAGKQIPLHDHPGMHGLIKVLHGKVKIASYSPVRSEHGNVLLVRPEREVIVTASDPPSKLGPVSKNLHEITIVDGPAAFFDILVPPYEPPTRDCHYYAPASSDAPAARSNGSLQGQQNGDANSEELIAFRRIRSPMSFVCESLPYKGPEIRLYKESFSTLV